MGREREEVGVGAAAERRDVGFAQRLTDVDVLAGNAIDLDRPLDQLVQLIGVVDRGVPELAVLTVAPRQLDLALMTAVEPAAEQMLDVLAHLRGIGLDQRLSGLGGHGTPWREGGAPSARNDAPKVTSGSQAPGRGRRPRGGR